MSGIVVFKLPGGYITFRPSWPYRSVSMHRAVHYRINSQYPIIHFTFFYNKFH